jgi:2-dehydropantoate 2-reductase
MSERIVVLGAGAVGGYVGGHLALHGNDVTLIDFWAENVEAIRANGLELSGMTAEERQVSHPKTMHMHEASSLTRQAPVDIAFVCMKSYDTEWVTQLIKPYLAPGGYVVSLQNCINEERIANVVGWGRTLGCIASRISVELFEPGKVRRQAPKGAASHTVFRVGEVHGLPTERARRVAELLSVVDGAKVTTNLWGERWSKLCHNAMRNGVAAATGLAGRQIDQHDHVRHFTIKLGGEAVRIGQALGYAIEKIGKLDPSTLARAGDGDRAAHEEIDAILVAESASNSGLRGELQRPSMGQDMLKGRRTEIDFINGHIVDKGAQIGIAAPCNEKIASVVKRVERRELPITIDNLRGI